MWLAIQAWRIYPPAFVTAGGHPDFGYYAYSYYHWSYSDMVALYGSRRLYLHLWPYFQNVIEYPVVIGLFMSCMALWPGLAGYFTASSIGLALAFLVALYALTRGRGSRALWFSLSPLLLVYGLMNWDLLGIATWGMAVLAYERGRYRASGLWLGVGVATKFFPIVLFPYLALSLWTKDRPGHRVDLRQFVLGSVISAVGLNLPFAVFADAGWSNFFTFNSGRAPDPGIWNALVHGHWLSLAHVNLLSLVLTGAGGAVILVAVWKGRLPPVPAAAAALAWWLLCNKVYSPQYMMWAYYALLWVDVSPVQWVLMNIMGLFDFGLAMQWLALGTTGSPFLSRFVAVVPLPIIAGRDGTLWLAALSAFLQRVHNRFRPREV